MAFAWIWHGSGTALAWLIIASKPGNSVRLLDGFQFLLRLSGIFALWA